MNTLWEEENSTEAKVKSEKCTESINEISMNETENVSRTKECENIGLTRTCPKCKKSILYKNKQTRDRLDNSKKLCRSCVQIQEDRSKVRNCPKCNKVLIYKEAWQRDRFEECGKLCLSCSHVKPVIDLNRKCPTCENTISYKRVQHFKRAEKENRSCEKCRPNKMFKVMTDKVRRGHKNTFLPNYSDDDCRYFEWLNKWMGWSGQYATSGGERNILKYFVDYYEPNQNVVIEWDEPYHRKKYQRKEDEDRKNQIKEVLGCKFFRYDVLTKTMKEV